MTKRRTYLEVSHHGSYFGKIQKKTEYVATKSEHAQTANGIVKPCRLTDFNLFRHYKIWLKPNTVSDVGRVSNHCHDYCHDENDSPRHETVFVYN